MFPFTKQQIKDVILRSDLELLFQFILSYEGKFVGFERHVLRRWEERNRIDETNIKARVDGMVKDGRRKFHYEKLKRTQVYILHRTPCGMFFGKQGYGEIDYSTDEAVVCSYTPNAGSEHIFHGIKHDKKILITDKNINSVVNNVYSIMSTWRWDMVGKHYSAGVGMRQFDVYCVDREIAYEKEKSYGIDIVTLDEWEKNGLN